MKRSTSERVAAPLWDTSWDAFLATGDERLWVALMPEVERLAGAVADLAARSAREREALFSIALAGLVAALERSPRRRNRSFAAFALPIMLREVRAYQLAHGGRRRTALGRVRPATRTAPVARVVN